MSAGADDESALGQAIAEYLDLERAGKAPPPSEFAAGHPEIAEALRSCIEVLATVGRTPPEVLGDFRLVRLIGRGGMGLVYEAEQRSLPRRVALKLLARVGSLDPERAQRFRREIEATARLQHPNIVPVYEAGEVAGLPYYAMPLLQGCSLDVVLRGFREAGASGALASRSELVRWIERFIGVARALDHAHDLGILHRDIKPSNLFLEDDGNLRILDFGLTRSSSAEGVTLTGQAVGTPRYMSPEQILGGRGEIDGRSDVFSLAATLYEMLALFPAFPGEDRETVFRAILSEDPVPLRRRDARIPRDLEVVVHKALEKDPRLRYATAGELADDLARFLDYEPVRARPVGPFGRLRRRARRNPLAAGAIALAALAVAGAAAALAFQAAERRAEAARMAREEVDRALALREDLRSASQLRSGLEEDLWREESRTPTWIPLASRVAVLDLRRETSSVREERDRLFREALSHLFSAQQLAPGDPSVRRALAQLVFEEYCDAESRRDRERMASLRPLVLSTDDGADRAEREGAGSIVLESDPPGAEAYLFRFEERDLRLVPVPFAAGSGSAVGGALAAAPESEPWLYLRVLEVEPAGAPLRRGDRIRLVCGSPPWSLGSVADHLGRPHPGHEEELHWVELQRGAEEKSIPLGPGTAPAIRGERVRRDPYPLVCGDANRVGPTPVGPLALPMGRYLALLRCSGSADVRVPFEVTRLERESLSVPIFAPKEGDEAYAYVPAGPAILGGDPGAVSSPPLREQDVRAFWIGRSEVTFLEYFEFLADLEREDPAQARERGPMSETGVPMWRLDEEGRITPALPRVSSLDCPAVGITWPDALAYCDWLEARAGDPALDFDLPTSEEWEKAGRGADGRLFPWGDTFEWTFASLGKSTYLSGTVPGGQFPTDESVYGVRDLAGSVREWCASPPTAKTRLVRGGDFATIIPADVHLANRSDRRSPEQVGDATGFRVVKRIRTGS